MLTFYGSTTRGPIKVDADPSKLSEHVDWIDAFEPSDADMAFLRTALGTRVPTLEDLVEIESSSRLAVEDGALIMSFPATTKDDVGFPRSTPVGFVVTPKRVATIRFAHLPSFENLAKQLCAKGELSGGGLRRNRDDPRDRRRPHRRPARTDRWRLRRDCRGPSSTPDSSADEASGRRTPTRDSRGCSRRSGATVISCPR